MLKLNISNISAAAKLRSFEADGGADGASDALSAVGLWEAAAASPVGLREREVVDRHHAVRRVGLQSREQLSTERPV